MVESSTKKTKRRILFAALKILLCFVLLVSSTFALFTDNEAATIQVSSADMEMDLLQLRDDGEYVSLVDNPGSVFGSYQWEPNQTRIAFLRIENNSDIPVKYTFSLDLTIGDFEGAFEYCAFRSEDFNGEGRNYKQLVEGREVYDLKDGTNSLVGNEYVSMDAGTKHDYIVLLHMKAEADNRYQGKVCDDLIVRVFAVQGNADTTAGTNTTDATERTD